MKRWFIFAVCWSSFGAVAQTTSPDTLVLVSQEVSDVDYGAFSLNTSYYTIANNIDNRQSMAFISDDPSFDERLHFAQHEPSFCFLVHHQRSVFRMILFRQHATGQRSSFSYTIINPSNGNRRKVPSRLSGQLTQPRAYELMESPITPASRLLNDTLCLLGDTRYKILTTEAVQQEVAALAHVLMNQEQGKLDDLMQYIRAETIGGTLDFEVALAQEPQHSFSRDGVVYNRARFSVLLWGGAVRMLGLRSVESARTLWEDIQQRSLTPPEWRALQRGFSERTLAEAQP